MIFFLKRKKKQKKAKEEKMSTELKIYASGNFRYNRKRTVRRGGVGVWFGPGDSRNLTYSLGLEYNSVTKVQLKALWVALVLVEMGDATKVRIYIKNRNIYNIFTERAEQWKINGWVNSLKRQVANHTMVQTMLQTIENIRQLGIDFKLKLTTIDDEGMDHAFFLARQASRCYKTV
jgi:ribonuclease HI